MFNQSSESQSNKQPMSMNHSAHEILHVNDVLNAMIGGLNQCVLVRDQIQDPELLIILDRQYAFMLDEYNITMEAL